jgi:hypothetical protein
MQPEEVSEPRLRSRFFDVAMCQGVPNSGKDYQQFKERAKAGRAAIF